MIETIKNNPLPAIIAGLSLGWMFTRGSDGNGYEDGRGSYGGATNRQRAGRGVPSRSASYSRETEGEESIGDRAGEIASRARESVSEFGEHAWEGVEHLGEGARHQVTRATNRFEEVLDESPLAAGAIALAAGAAVGLAIPLTRREDEFMGETRDHLVHQVQHKAEETWEKAKRVGEKTMEEAERTAKEEAGRQKIA